MNAARQAAACASNAMSNFLHYTTTQRFAQLLARSNTAAIDKKIQWDGGSGQACLRSQRQSATADAAPPQATLRGAGAMARKPDSKASARRKKPLAAPASSTTISSEDSPGEAEATACQ